MEEITLDRTGDRPLKFRGELIAEGDSQIIQGSDHNRWHELALYRHEDRERYILAIGYRTQWQGEAAHDDVFVCLSAAEACEIIRSTLPTEHLMGFPLGDQYAGKQARLEKDLETRFFLAAEPLLKALGPEELGPMPPAEETKN